MSSETNERRNFDPLDRSTFDAIAYNAVGRASEIGTYPALNLTHSNGNSGWSVGIVQWDFGQGSRGEKVDELMAGYQAWASPEARFTPQEVTSLTARLRTPGQTGNALGAGEESRLNGYLRSDPGREFVSSLNQEQVAKKWANVGEPLSRIEWLRELRATDPAQAAEIVAQTTKLYNQNENRGGRLIAHLRTTALTSEQTRDWIGTEGIDGLTPSARTAIVTGRDNAIAGARLMSELELGEGRLSQAWRREVYENDNASLFANFNNSPDVQLLDAMMRNPAAGHTILAYANGEGPSRSVVVRGTDEKAALEMSRVELTRGGELTVTSPRGDEFLMTREGWNRNGIPMQGRQPGREADEPDYMEGMLRTRPLTPDHAQHPDHSMLEQIRAHVRGLDRQAGGEYDEGSERFSRSLLAASKDNRDMYPDKPGAPLASNALERVDHVVIGKDGRYAFAVQGELDDSAHKRAHVDIVQARQTPVEQSDAKLEAANQQIAQERQLATQQELQRQQIDTLDPSMGALVRRS
jgi:hypothetical protein